MSGPSFTVCVLLYGDFPHLARRILDSLYRPEWLDQFELRVACNAVCDETAQIVRDYTRGWGRKEMLDPDNLFISTVNAWKYPMMRRMFYDRPLTTPYVMWFDDDSYIKADASNNWFRHVARNMRDADMLGAKYVTRMCGNQHLWVRSRPWYADKPVEYRSQMTFVVGCWWVARTELVSKWDYPEQDIKHFGGDAVLGELCRQQGYKLKQFTDGVAIGADAAGKQLAAERRHSKAVRWIPVGYSYES